MLQTVILYRAKKEIMDQVKVCKHASAIMSSSCVVSGLKMFSNHAHNNHDLYFGPVGVQTEKEMFLSVVLICT